MAGAEPQPVPHMTAAEFMAWDGGGHIGKLELINGEVRAMSPASGTVSVLKANLAALVGGHIRFKILPLRVGILPRSNRACMPTITYARPTSP